MNLAAVLASAERSLRATERRVEHLLTTLFPAWKGWSFESPARIEVWQAPYEPSAAAVLFRHGFREVVLHDHRSERFLSCACRTWTPPAPVDPRTL